MSRTEAVSGGRRIAEEHAPLVSVIMCAFDAGRYLRESLESVLVQTYRNLEIVVVDDGSTDGSVAAMQSWCTDARVNWVTQARAGKAVAMNRALDMIRGSFYAIQDADDVSYPLRIERQVQALLSHSHVAAAFCGHDLLVNGQRIAPTLRSKSEEECRRAIDALAMPAHDPTGMYRVSMVAGLRYEPDLLVGQGYDYILRVGETQPMIVIPECLYSYRVHSSSVTRAEWRSRERMVMKVQARARARRGIPHAADAAGGGARRSRTRISDNGLATHCLESAVDLVRERRRGEAVRVGLWCSSRCLSDPHYYKPLICALSPQWIIRRLRRYRQTAQ